MSDASLIVQAALYTTLVAAVAPVPVYDFVPANAPFPHVALDGNQTLPEDTKTTFGQIHAGMVHIWSHAAGRKESREIAGAVYAALHEAPLSLPGFSLVSCRVTSVLGPSLDADGTTYHTVLNFELETQG